MSEIIRLNPRMAEMRLVHVIWMIKTFLVSRGSPRASFYNPPPSASYFPSFQTSYASGGWETLLIRYSEVLQSSILVHLASLSYHQSCRVIQRFKKPSPNKINFHRAAQSLFLVVPSVPVDTTCFFEWYSVHSAVRVYYVLHSCVCRGGFFNQEGPSGWIPRLLNLVCKTEF